MATTAHEDQFTPSTQTIEPVRQPYDMVAILHRNIADMEVALRTQTERAESYAETLRPLASYVGAGGYNADTVDAGVFEDKIRWGIRAIQGQLIAAIERAETAEAELANLAQQKPVAWCDADGDFYSGKHYPNVWPSAVPLFAAPVPAPHPGATHCDDCGLTWLDDGLNPLGCPYCKTHASERNARRYLALREDGVKVDIKGGWLSECYLDAAADRLLEGGK